MNSRPILVLLVVVALSAGALYLLRTNDAPTRGAVDPLRLIDYDGIKVLACEPAGATPWRIEREVSGDRRARLVSADIAKGQPVAADDTKFARLAGFLNDARPTAELDAAKLDLAKIGLLPPRYRITIEDRERRHVLEVGRPDANDEVAYRAAGADAVFRLPAHVFRDYGQDAKWLRDPHLFSLRSAHIETVTITPSNGTPFQLERIGSRWFLRDGDSGPLRADRPRAEEFVSAVTAATAQANGDDDTEGAPSSLEIEARAKAGGKTEKIIVFAPKDEKSMFLVRRPGDPDIRRLGREFKRLFDLRADSFRDPEVTGFDEIELAEVVIDGPGRPDVLHLAQRSGHWFLKRDEPTQVRVDQDRFRGFRDALLHMRVERHLAEMPTFEPVVTARFVFSDRSPLEPVSIELSVVGSDGTHRVRRSDSPGGAVIPAAAVEVLFTPSWELRLPVVALGNDAQIDRLALTDANGRRIEALKSKIDDGSSVWRIGDSTVPVESLRGLLGKLVYLTVTGFVGPSTPESDAGFAAPKWVIEWRHVGPERTREGRAAGDVEYRLEIGRRVAADRLEARLNQVPGLVFLLDAAEFYLIDDAWRSLRAAGG